MINYAPSDILRKCLIDADMGQYPDDGVQTPIFTTSMPEDGDLAVCVYDTAGRMDRRGRCMRGPVQDYPGVQLRFRGKTAPEAYDLAKRFQDALEAIVVRTVNMDDESIYILQGFRRVSTIVYVGEEPERQRQLYSLNGTLSYNLKPMEEQ